MLPLAYCQAPVPANRVAPLRKCHFTRHGRWLNMAEHPQPPMLQPPMLQPPVLHPQVLQPPLLQPPMLQPPLLQPPLRKLRCRAPSHCRLANDPERKSHRRHWAIHHRRRLNQAQSAVHQWLTNRDGPATTENGHKKSTRRFNSFSIIEDQLIALTLLIMSIVSVLEIILMPHFPNVRYIFSVPVRDFQSG